MLNGIPRFDLNVSNRVDATPTRLADVFCFIGETEYGEFDKPTLVKTEKEYRDLFGSLSLNVANSISPTAIAALKKGVQLRITRVGKKDESGVIDAGNKSSYSYSTVLELQSKWVGSYSNYLKVKRTSSFRVANTTTLEFDTYHNFEVKYGNSVVERFSLIEGIVTLEAIQTVNKLLKYVQVSEGKANTNLTTWGFYANEAQLASGTYNAAAVSDYIGSQDLKTGMYALDTVNSIKFVSAPKFHVNELDLELVSYASKRNAIALIATPSGLSGLLPVAYRNATVPYAGTKVDNFRGFGTTAHIKVRMKNDDGVMSEYTVSNVAYTAASIATKNKLGKTWENYSIEAYSTITDAVGVDVNYGVDSLRDAADAVFNSGLNAFVQDSTGVIKSMGASTLQDTYSALSFTGNVELLQEIIFRIQPIFKSYLHKTNKVETWKLLYLEVSRILDDYKSEGAIFDYVYSGDQDVDDISQAVVNNIEDVNAGKYKVILEIQFYSTMLYISLDVFASFAGVEFSVNE